MKTCIIYDILSKTECVYSRCSNKSSVNLVEIIITPAFYPNHTNENSHNTLNHLMIVQNGMPF